MLPLEPYLILPPPPRKSVLILLPLFAILLSLAPIVQAQAPTITFPSATNVGATRLGIEFRISGAIPDKFEARLDAGAWRDVTSHVWRGGRIRVYVVTGLQPATEYTLSLRASAGSSTSAPVSVTATTLSRAIDYNARFCRDNGVNKLLLIGLDSPGNASYEFQLFLNVFPGQSSSRDRVAFDHDTIANTTREITVGAVEEGERVFGSLLQILSGSSVSFMRLQFFGSDRLPACYPPPPKGSSSSCTVCRPYMTPTPIRDSINHLPPGIVVSNWLDGAQGQQVDHVGAGRPDAVNQHNFIDGVNIWGHVTPGIEVCFQQTGSLLFIDSVYPPVDPIVPPSHQRDGMTCTTVDTAGTVVLLRDEAIATPIPSSQTLSGCDVRPWADLNFRQSPPAGAVIGVTSTSVWLPASEKSAGYFKVRLWDVEGWLSGDYVYTRGQCGS